MRCDTLASRTSEHKYVKGGIVMLSGSMGALGLMDEFRFSVLCVDHSEYECGRNPTKVPQPQNFECHCLKHVLS